MWSIFMLVFSRCFLVAAPVHTAKVQLVMRTSFVEDGGSKPHLVIKYAF